MKTSEQINPPQAPMIYKKIIEVMKSITAIGKSRKNQVQGWSFRGIDDVYNELHQPLAEVGVFTIPEILEERTEERITAKGGLLIYRIMKIKFTFFAEDGSSVAAIVIGEGMDSGDKATNKAMSIAHKYALMQVFAIATEDPKDPDLESHQILPKQPLKPEVPPPVFNSQVEKHYDRLKGLLEAEKISLDCIEAVIKKVDGMPLSGIKDAVLAFKGTLS